MFDPRVTVRTLASNRTLARTLAHFDPRVGSSPGWPCAQVHVSEARVIIWAVAEWRGRVSEIKQGCVKIDRSRTSDFKDEVRTVWRLRSRTSSGETRNTRTEKAGFPVIKIRQTFWRRDPSIEEITVLSVKKVQPNLLCSWPEENTKKEAVDRWALQVYGQSNGSKPRAYIWEVFRRKCFNQHCKALGWSAKKTRYCALITEVNNRKNNDMVPGSYT